MKTLNTLGLTAALTALAAGSLLADTTVISAAPANFQGDSSGNTYAIGEIGPGSSNKYLDVEGPGPQNAKGTDANYYDTFAVIDFTGNSVYDPNTGNAETITSINPNITLGLTDGSFSQSRPTALNFYLSDNNVAASSLRYQTSDASNPTAGVGSQLSDLYYLGSGTDNESGATNVGSLLSYNLTLPAAAQAYFIQQLNNDVNPANGDTTTTPNLTNLRFVVTAPGSTSGVAAFAGATGPAGTSTSYTDGPGAPTLTFTTSDISPAPEPSQTAAMGLTVLGLLGLVARKRVLAKKSA